MRLGALRAAGLVCISLGLASCAPTSDFISSSHLWPWKRGQGAPGLTADLAKPFPRGYARIDDAQPDDARPAITALGRPDEFDDEHPLVDEYIRKFQNEWRGFYGRALERSTRYVPRMAAILAREGVPTDLAYLPLIESGFVTHAVSHAGATGPWQFIAPTGRRYGLRIDHYVDERRDPTKSTEAAARYLKDLYALFGNWNLSIAAYNTGEGNIARILEKRGAKHFWDMVGRGYLHKETEQYVPRFLAAIQIAREPEAFGFELPEDPEDAMSYDWVHVSHSLPLAKVAELAGTSKDVIKQLNPALRRDVVPGSGYTVKIPKGTKRQYQLAAAKIDPRLYAWNPRTAGCQTDEGLHCVQRGETIGGIASKYRIPVDKLMRANGINNARTLQVGKSLHIPGQRKGTATAKAAAPARAAAGVYKVRPGDTLGHIADRHGTSSKVLMAANGIRNPRSLNVGQSIRIPGGTTVAAAAPANSRVKTTSRVHTLRSGETVGAIAQRYGVSTKEILAANGIRNARGLQIARRLVIPGNATVAATQVTAPLVAAAKAAPAPAPAAKAAPAKKAASSGSHPMRPGETLGGIAQRYGISARALMQANGISDARRVRAGRTLVIPGSSAGSRTANVAAAPRTHKVRNGDSPYSIARRYQVSVDALLKANGIRDPRGLRPGQVLKVPEGDGQLAAR